MKNVMEIQGYKALIAFSAHMQDEFARHGIDVTCVGPPMESGPLSSGDLPDRSARDTWQLLFIGRMDLLKGGGYLLDALPRVASALNRRLDVTFAGDGPADESWQDVASGVAAREAGRRITFQTRRVISSVMAFRLS